MDSDVGRSSRLDPAARLGRRAGIDDPGRAPRPGAAVSAFYHLVRLTSIPLLRLYFRLEAVGGAHVPARGPALLAANHASYLDPAVLGSACPRQVFFLMRRSTWEHPSMNWFYRGMQAIPVDRSRSVRAALSAALLRLHEGNVVGIFPEGVRAAPGQDAEHLPGVALLARRSGAPVVPVGIRGTDVAMPVGRAIPEPVPVRVAFGAPRHHAAAAGVDLREADEGFTSGLMAEVRRLAGEGAGT